MTEPIRKVVLTEAYQHKVDDAIRAINIRLSATWKPGMAVDCYHLVDHLTRFEKDLLNERLTSTEAGWTVTDTPREYLIS